MDLILEIIKLLTAFLSLLEKFPPSIVDNKGKKKSDQN